jgi:hypothetical protein
MITIVKIMITIVNLAGRSQCSRDHADQPRGDPHQDLLGQLRDCSGKV